jgi:uncharacterized membrane protein
MSRNVVPLTLLTVTLATVLAGMLITSQQMPARVASHFNARGVPDGWMPRSSYTLATISMTIGLAIFLVAAFSITRFAPDAMINLPNRDFWLDPERRQQTCDTIFRYGVWLAILVTVLFLVMHLFVVAANAAQPVNLSNEVWIILAVFLLTFIAWAVLFMRQFRLPI